MSKSTRLEQLDALRIHENAEESPSRENLSSELLEREPIGGTPFWILGNNVDGYCLVMGKYRLTEIKASKTEVVEELEGNMWNIIFNLVICIHESIKQEENKNVELLNFKKDIGNSES